MYASTGLDWDREASTVNRAGVRDPGFEEAGVLISALVAGHTTPSLSWSSRPLPDQTAELSPCPFLPEERGPVIRLDTFGILEDFELETPHLVMRRTESEAQPGRAPTVE